jgi:hypothetical protein
MTTSLTHLLITVAIGIIGSTIFNLLARRWFPLQIAATIDRPARWSALPVLSWVCMAAWDLVSHHLLYISAAIAGAFVLMLGWYKWM